MDYIRQQKKESNNCNGAVIFVYAVDTRHLSAKFRKRVISVAEDITTTEAFVKQNLEHPKVGELSQET